MVVIRYEEQHATCMDGMQWFNRSELLSGIYEVNRRFDDLDRLIRAKKVRNLSCFCFNESDMMPYIYLGQI